MKKLLLAAISMAFASNVNAADGADVKFNAEMRFRFSSIENTGFGGSVAGGGDDENGHPHDTFTQQRNKLGLHFTKSEDLMAHVTLLHFATWGNAGAGNASGFANPNTIGVTEDLLGVHEAWVFWKAMDNFSVRVGRGALDIADGSVIAKNDWLQSPWAFEGALATYYTEWANINVFGVKGMNDETDNGAGNTADVNFYGLSVDVKNLPEVIKMANIHILQSKATGLAIGLPGFGSLDKDEKTRYGATVKGDFAGFDYRGTYAMYEGEFTTIAGNKKKLDNEANMFDLEVGYTLPAMMNLRIHGIMHEDTGDKDTTLGATDTKAERYDAFFYEQHANAGAMDIVNWGNLSYWKLGVALEPMEMVKAGVDYYTFTKTEKADTTVGTGNAGVLVTSATSDDLGEEIDVWVSKTLSNGAELNARYGQFSPGKTLKESAIVQKQDITEYQVGATFRF